MKGHVCAKWRRSKRKGEWVVEEKKRDTKIISFKMEITEVGRGAVSAGSDQERYMIRVYLASVVTHKPNTCIAFVIR